MKIKGHIYKSFMIPRKRILQSTKQRVQTCDFTINNQSSYNCFRNLCSHFQLSDFLTTNKTIKLKRESPFIKCVTSLNKARVDICKFH